MDEFNYLGVLISIILGLGITRLLQGLGQQIEFRTQVRGYWPSLAWAVILLVIHIQTWWSMFPLRYKQDWTFLGFLIVLLQPIVLYLLAAVVLPAPQSGERVDLRAHYYGQSRWFFGLFVMLLLISLAKGLMLSGGRLDPVDLAFHLAFLSTSVACAVSARPRVHETVTVATAALIAVYIAELFSRLR